MIIDFSEQGTPEWDQSRLAIPTSSKFGSIVTPTCKKSTQAEAFMNHLVAEWLEGRPVEHRTFGSMANGTETEPQARDAYEFITGNDVVETGVVYKDSDKLVGCSPDGLLCSIRKGVEIKCPDPHTHIGYLLAEKLPNIYIPQVQGSMFVTGYDEWDFMSFHPNYPPLIITVKRDEEYIEKLETVLHVFTKNMLDKREKLEQYKR